MNLQNSNFGNLSIINDAEKQKNYLDLILKNWSDWNLKIRLNFRLKIGILI